MRINTIQCSWLFLSVCICNILTIKFLQALDLRTLIKGFGTFLTVRTILAEKNKSAPKTFLGYSIHQNRKEFFVQVLAALHV